MLQFENNSDQLGQQRYFIPTELIKDYNAMIDGKIFFDQTAENENIWKY